MTPLHKPAKEPLKLFTFHALYSQAENNGIGLAIMLDDFRGNTEYVENNIQVGERFIQYLTVGIYLIKRYQNGFGRFKFHLFPSLIVNSFQDTTNDTV